MKTITMLACCLLTACSGATASELLEPCDVPESAEYVMSGYSSECNMIQFPVTFTAGEPYETSGRGAETELLAGACMVRTTGERMSLVVNWDRGWTYGVGSYTERGCTWNVDLVRKP